MKKLLIEEESVDFIYGLDNGEYTITCMNFWKFNGYYDACIYDKFTCNVEILTDFNTKQVYYILEYNNKKIALDTIYTNLYDYLDFFTEV